MLRPVDEVSGIFGLDVLALLYPRVNTRRVTVYLFEHAIVAFDMVVCTRFVRSAMMVPQLDWVILCVCAHKIFKIARAIVIGRHRAFDVVERSIKHVQRDEGQRFEEL